jgi:hypothetical protein
LKSATQALAAIAGIFCSVAVVVILAGPSFNGSQTDFLLLPLFVIIVLVGFTASLVERFGTF